MKVINVEALKINYKKTLMTSTHTHITTQTKGNLGSIKFHPKKTQQNLNCKKKRNISNWMAGINPT